MNIFESAKRYSQGKTNDFKIWEITWKAWKIVKKYKIWDILNPFRSFHWNKKTSGKIAFKFNHLVSSTKNFLGHCPENPFIKEQQNYADNTKMISSQVKQQNIGKEYIWEITVSSFTNQENKCGSNIYRKQAIRSKCRLLVNQEMLLLFTRFSY